MSVAIKESTSKIWYYESNGDRVGPVTEAELSDLIKSNILFSSSLVWKEGFGSWVNIAETDLKKYLDTKSPPPLAGDKVNNTVAWVLAFAPIIGYLLQYFIAGVLWGDNFQQNVDSIWYVTLVLNVVLGIIDERKLDKAGHSTNKLRGWVWLVPVYLYQRAKLLKQSLSYFVVWLVCFFIVLFS